METLAGNGNGPSGANLAVVGRETRERGIRGAAGERGVLLFSAICECGTIDFAIKVRAQSRDLCQKRRVANSTRPATMCAMLSAVSEEKPESWSTTREL